jgi:vitamin B12 transporter
MKTTLFACAAAAAMLSMGGRALAQGQTPPAAEDAGSTQVEQVNVGAELEQDLPIQLAKQGVRVDVVTAATIKNAQYVDVTQALQTTVPGLYISPKNGPFDYVNISLQGSRTEDVLWLEDGVRLNNRLYGGTTPLDTLPASMIERIEVVEGPEALFYGTQSVAGAINIITRDFSDTLNGQVTVGGDTNDSYHVDAYVRGPLGPGKLVLYGSADQSSGFLPFPEQDFQPSATQRDRAYKMFGLGGKYTMNLTDQLRLTLSEQHNQGRLDYAVPELVEEAYNARDEDILTGKIDYTPSDVLQFYLKGYYHWWRSHYTEYDNDLSTPGTLDTVEDDGPWGYVDRGVNAMAKAEPIKGIDFYAGYDLQNYWGSDAVLVITKHSETVNAVFGEIATTPDLIHNLTLAAGVRYNDPTTGQSATVGDVSARYDFGDGFYAKAMAGTAFRLPTAEELYADDPDDERGDPDLKPESSQNLNVSLGGHAIGLDGLHWEVIGFFRNVKNLIDYASFDSTTDQAVFGNVPGIVQVRGGEVALDGALTPDISASGSYTYSSAKQSGGPQIQDIPVSIAKATLDYHPLAMPFGLTASMNYVGSVYNAPIGTNLNYGNYVVFNASARWFLDKARHHRIDVGVNNITGKRYATGLTEGVSDATGDAYPVPDLGQPRTLTARYTFSF